MPFDYVLSFDSSIWSLVGANWTPASNWGWRGVSEASTGYVSSLSSMSNCYYYYGKVRYVGSTHTSVYDYVYHDPGGALHPFSGGSNVWAGNGNGGCALGKNNGVTATATDGSGYTLNANMNSGTVTASSGATVRSLSQSNVAAAFKSLRNFLSTAVVSVIA